MKRILKYIGYFVAVVALFVVEIVSYHFRAQEIDVGLIPNEFNYCGSKIYGNNPQYQEISDWLKRNKDEWKKSYASFVPGNEYHSQSFNISVHPDFVVVWYKTDEGYPQFVKSIKSELPLSCQ